jgi:hypothetical protein
MNESEPRPVFPLPVRDIPIPTSVSKEAQAKLSLGPLGPAADTEWPALDDLEAWRSLVKHQDKAMQPMMLVTATTAARDGAPRSNVPAEVEDIEIQEVPIYAITQRAFPPTTDRCTWTSLAGRGSWGRG